MVSTAVKAFQQNSYVLSSIQTAAITELVYNCFKLIERPLEEAIHPKMSKNSCNQNMAFHRTNRETEPIIKPDWCERRFISHRHVITAR